ncbi:ABC transporter ATP-binding protein/permease [Veillonella dispar]|uniref:Macrolide export ATP-binding/permease protein MacB n=3 Tax=Bacillota TaxID=1239 RepID=A0A6N2YE16_9FIRM|nr:MAG: ABC transporter, ATP-binding protein [Veillonella dispar DORA_11]
MLQIKQIKKTYKTGDLVQHALKGVDLNLRDNEFVAILGPSGSGKTTLLNIIGGLDRYDSGDLIINGISTKKYKDKDWDSYRNHTVGFVFQSYNLIPHQTVLSNVELALTISGISKSERREKALKALEEVGLKEQAHKKPNQMSGGQMQRVAIARALVNDPDILLADEPTGALDSETSVQVMDLLQEVAKKRLVVMVTHNPELAEEYATRIVKVKDGNIIDDSNPFVVDASTIGKEQHKNMGKLSMSFLTSLSLSFNNLMTKKTRTLLTAFAGSIGIIGIALILALSTGVNSYIENIQKDTMTSYPISIDAKSFDLSDIMGSGMNPNSENDKVNHDKNKVYSNGTQIETASKMATSITENNLTPFKKYLDNPNSEIHKYVGDVGIVYSYDVKFDAFAYDKNGTLVNTDGSTLSVGNNSNLNAMNSMMEARNSMVGNSLSVSNDTFKQLMPGKNNELVSDVVKDSYEMVHGNWPKSENDVVLVLNKNNEIPLTALYALGLLPSEDYQDLMNSVENDDNFKAKQYDFDYDKIMEQKFYVVPSSDYYVANGDGTFSYIGDDKSEVKKLLKNAEELNISGIIRPKEDASNANLTGAVGYTQALSNKVTKHAKESAVVKAQLKSPDVNVLNGLTFEPDNDKEKIADAKKYIKNLNVSDKASLIKTISATSGQSNMMSMDSMSEVQLASLLDSYMQNPDDEVLLSIYNNSISSGSYDDNMTAFGYVSEDKPSSISIYADSFEDKDMISECIEKYNEGVSDENKITYTDFVKVLMSSVTTIINVITYVLIAFVAVSLVVSSIMIGIITYISVLERTKEIGILRAIGASKRNVSQVFTAETFIIGLCSGLIGVGTACLLLIPGNAIIHSLLGTTDVSAYLPVSNALVLISLSVILTLIGGLFPSKAAAKQDPVTSLRSE